LLHILKSQDFTTHIHWISSHRDIIDNKKADIVVHKGAEQKVKLHSERFISISYMKDLIKAKVLASWENHWNLVKKGCTYTHMKVKSHWNQNKHLKNINRLQFSTFTQMKLDHDYFKFYLNRLSDYDSDKCHWSCQQRQTSEHLLTICHHFRHEQLVLRRKLEDLSPEIRTLFTIKKEIQTVLQFLKETEVEIRKWLLEEKVEEEID